MDDKMVRCPNFCLEGKVKVSSGDRSLFDLTNCPYCKGKGNVTKREFETITKKL